jgi:hypothetical protein
LGEHARAKVTVKSVAAVKDWTAFAAWVIEQGDLSVLQRRVNNAAIAERWANKEQVPGCEPYNVIDVSVTKL